MKKWIFLIAQAAFLSAASANNLLIIGVNDNNEEHVHQTKIEKVESALIAANAERQKLALEVLQKNQDQSSWKLSKFSLGLGVEGEAGIGPWNLGLAIKQRVFFKRVQEGAL